MSMYLELKEKRQKEINEFPFFFAFSNEQFDEGMRKIGLEPNETDKIYRFGVGGFYKKTDSPRLKEMLTRHREEEKKAMQNDEYVLEMFRYEMWNHEYQISRDKEDVLDACGLELDDMDERLESLWSKARKIYLKTCEENDWY